MVAIGVPGDGVGGGGGGQHSNLFVYKVSDLSLMERAQSMTHQLPHCPILLLLYVTGTPGYKSVRIFTNLEQGFLVLVRKRAAETILSNLSSSSKQKQ